MSEVKVNKISPRTNCGTVQLGDSGDTITIPAGVTITNSGTAAGFGSTGEVSWNTTKVTTGFTAASGIGYFADTRLSSNANGACYPYCRSWKTYQFEESTVSSSRRDGEGMQKD